MNNLTNEEIDVLMESLDALQSKSVTDGLFSSIFMSAFSSDREQAKRDMDLIMEKAQAEANTIKEKIILLKAKLIGMKDKNVVHEASEFLKRG